MKKIIFFISLLAISCWLIANSVGAQEAQPIEEITTNDLGVENPGILPSSPFYFLKEWRRGIKKMLTFDPVKKAELELKEANERAAEIKKLEEVAPSNIEAITKAAANYQKNVERLKNRLEGLKETSQNPNVDKLLDKLVERSLQHQQLFDNLKLKFEEKAELKEQLKAGQEKIDEVITKISEKFENIDAFKQRLEKAIENQPEGVFKELRAVEAVDRIKEKLPEEQQGKIQELKDKFIEKFENRIEKLKESEQVKIMNPEILKKMPGDQIQRIKILEEIKENLNPEIQQKIQEAKEAILESKVQKQTEEKTGENPCAQEAKICPDGSSVGRTGPNCEFASCPASIKAEQPVCVQVITPAISTEGICKNFSTPCEVPLNWQKVEKCPASQE
jgi:chromosome segregation ATPase